MGYLAAFGFVLLLLVGMYCFGYAARQASLLYVLLLETILGVVFIFPLLCLEPGFTPQQLFTKPTHLNFIWLGGAAVCGFAGGNYFTLLNLRTAGEKINSLLSPAITAFTLFLSYFIFSERLVGIQWVGASLTLAVVTWFLFSRGSWQKKEGNSAAAIGSGIATVICISGSIICSIKGASGGHISYLHAIWLRLLFALVIVSGLFTSSRTYQKVKPQSKRFYWAIIGGVIAQSILANYLSLYATFEIGLSIFQVIIATLPLWTYVVDVYLLKKSVPSPLFIGISLAAAIGIGLVML
jgi:drug/metabolite transporter (DMT)-like permease